MSGAKKFTYPTDRRDHLADIESYAQDVMTGVRQANIYERLALERESKDLDAANDPGFEFFFDPVCAIDAIRFIEKFGHVKGKWASAKGTEKLISLAPWQKWIVAQIFGWKEKSSGLRRFRSATVIVPRKNGKSTLAAGISLYMLTKDGESGAEVYCGATSQKQANEVFNPAKKMAQNHPAFRRQFGVDCRAQVIAVEETNSKFERLIGNPGDGGSPSCYICDEYHEHDDDDQRETMITGMGAREQPLEFIITTAGSSWFGPCGQHQQECQNLLEGHHSDDRSFCVIYTIDKDDDWQSIDALIKANPNYGISVKSQYLSIRLQVALQSARKQNSFKTKHLNIWVGAREGWLNMEDWNKQADPALDIEDFLGLECAKGLDLSESDDLTADVNCFPKELDGKTHYYLFAKNYTTELKISEIGIYEDWRDSGFLLECEGSSIEYDDVERAIALDDEQYMVKGLFYDPAGAAPIAQRVQLETSIEVIKIQQNYTNFSPAMREFENLLRQGRIHHNGDPVMAWCFSNVIAKETMDGKYFRPVKEHKDNKIDTAVAALLAFIGAWAPEEQEEESCVM